MTSRAPYPNFAPRAPRNGILRPARAVAIFCAPCAALLISSHARAVTYLNGEMPTTAIVGPLIVDNSPGGFLTTAMTTMKGFVIRKRCASACAWAYAINVDACHLDSAQLEFHGFRNPDGSRNEVANGYWLARVPMQVRLAIGDDVLTGDDLVILTGDVLNLLLPHKHCEANP